MPSNPDHQGRRNQDAEQFTGFGCLSFGVVCIALALWWLIKTLWGMLP